MNKKVAIVGDHQMVHELERQYQAKGFIVERQKEVSACQEIGAYDEFFLLASNGDITPTEADSQAIDALKYLADHEDTSRHDGHRLRCHLLLRSRTTLWMIQTFDFPDGINTVLDVYPFTIEDQWAKNVLVKMPGAQTPYDYPPLDRTPISKDSTQMVHLVISGFSEQAEALAIHTALIAHYPNYRSSDEQPLRTRITIVDEDICQQRDKLIAKYQRLFEHSYYRTIFPLEEQSTFHDPQTMGCTDVEWEFVQGDLFQPVITQKLSFWATSTTQCLSIAIAHGDMGRDMSEAISLPSVVYEQQVTVYLQMQDASPCSLLRQSERYQNIFPFGMRDCGYDVSLPLMRMARLLNAFYFGLADVEQGTVDEHKADEAWSSLPSYAKRFSNLYNVMTIPTKMRSLGHDDNDWDTFYAISEKEVQEIAEVEHNRWNVEELILGFRPCTDAETKAVEASINEYLRCQRTNQLDGWALKDKRGRICTLKEIYKEDDLRRAHYDLRPYSDLRIDKSGLNVRHYDIDLSACIPLLANSFKKGGVS